VITKQGIACAKCRTRIGVREVPRDVAHKLPPEARWVIAELEPRAHDEGREAISVHCQECGAPLEVDGRERAFACTFCKAHNVLSDDVWARLHPTPVKRPFYVWIDDDAIARDHAQHDAAAKTRAREQAPGAMVTYAGIATVLFAGSMYAAHQCSTSDAAGWFFALIFAGALALAFGVFASRELRTILASPGREDAVDITMLAIGVAIVVLALVLHFALHASWPASCLVIAVGASVGGGPILEAAS
jgi:DNA-directed RNA polymerase subunit RPC12/RpoP